jgi:hypothetical protein
MSLSTVRPAGCGEWASMARLVACLALATFPIAHSAQAAVLSVSGDANIFGAGHASAPQPGGGGAGILPPGVSFPAGPSQVLTFSSVTGTVRIDFDNTPAGTSGPDGGTLYLPTDISSFSGISGVTLNQRTLFMVGVFLNSAEPADPAPARLDFSDAALTRSFTTLSPALNQVFFIGDGLTGTGSGSSQQFFVPNSATRLFLGFADAYTMSTNSITGPPGFYADNDGALTATFTISLEGDYNQNGTVDAADYVLWRKSSGTYGGNPAGYNTWRANFGHPPGSGSGTVVSANAAVPEPTASLLLLPMVAGLSFLRRRAALSSQKVVRM